MTQKYNHLAEFKNHEQVVELNDPASGLKGFIAIHNGSLGPALGGTRVFPYKNKQAALKDVLSLSRAMTYKSALAGLPFGGGKGVIIADPKNKNIKKILKSYAQQVKKLKGKFYTGEDVGLSEADVHYMLKFCPYFIGKKQLAGDPSPYAGLSAFLCIKETLKFLHGSPSVAGKTFTVKGAGKTGGALMELINNEGGKIIAVADTSPERIKHLKAKYPGIKIVAKEKIAAIAADVFCPCALGRDITKSNIKNLKVKIVAGTANNQLESPEIARQLFAKGIIHVPDYIANGGGLINVANELLSGTFRRNRVIKSINKIPDILNEVLEISKKQNTNPDEVADSIAEKIFNKSPRKLNFALRAIQAILRR